VTYDSPGFADSASAAVLAAWNQEIQSTFTSLRGDPDLARSTPYLLPDPANVPGPPVDAVHWPGDPAEPRFCLNAAWAQKLSDWGVRGRHLFHNEYCEYAVILRPDAAGRMRPKRFTATTELAEWWTIVATHDPTLLRQMATEVLGTEPSFADLYGGGVTLPATLSPQQRRIRFASQVAGNGQHKDLEAAGVLADPIGDLNTRNALFMSHQINGLDDLIYIVMFGAQPYAVRSGGAYRRARLHEIFQAQGATQLACRNADPAAAQGAYDQVLRSIAPDGATARGCQLAFANPIGMYIRSFNGAGLTYNDDAVPASWTKLRRGKPGFEQRLEFGPPDDEPVFLDDVLVEQGAEQTPLIGGYQLVARIEVGPKVLIGPEREFVPAIAEIPESTQSLVCSQAEVCTERVGPAKTAYENEHRPPSPRGRG
jgi:hypothetical protein